ncbi:hypothetical protein BASA60_002648 [Batrachochytrium salamandrivorans]|nr:hypothetical protein BASA60_002648 [Batrachochytrium salamandrivorans]
MFFSLNSVESANTLGQAYLRPMGVLNDARCYSACEVFSGAIQGHDAGTIFGEDEQTGGGGAIVKELDPYLVHAFPTYFQKFIQPGAYQWFYNIRKYTHSWCHPDCCALVAIMANH